MYPMPSIVKHLFPIFIACVLVACDNADKRRNQYLEEGKVLYGQGEIKKARAAFDKAAAVEPENDQAHLQLAEEILGLGDGQTAVKHYLAIIKHDPKQAVARVKLGQILLLAGKVSEAEKTAQDALVLDADNIEALVLSGSVLSAQNNTDAAFLKAELALTIKPDDISATLLLAALKGKTGKLDEAAGLLQRCLEQNPKEVAPRLMLANLYQQKGEAEKIRGLLVSIIDQEPKQLLHRRRLALFYLNANQKDKAEDVLRTAIKDLPDDEQAKLLLAEFLAANKTRESAIAELIPMLEQKSDQFELRFKLAELQLAQQHLGDVEDILKESVELAGGKPQAPWARNKLAQYYLAYNRVEDAKKLVNTTLAEQPDNQDALILKAELALADGKAADAIAGLRGIIAESPSSIKALKLLARAHANNNDRQLQLENLQKILDIAPTDEDIRIELVDLLFKTGNAKQAEQQLNALFKLNPDSKAGLEALTKIYLAQKQWERARQTAKAMQVRYADDASGYYLEGLSYQAEEKLEKSVEPLTLALKKQPQAIEPLNQLVSAYLLLKQTDKAVVTLNEIVKNHPDHFIAYNLLGGVYSNAGKMDEAVTAYQKAIEIKPDWTKTYRNLAVIKQLQKKPEEAVEILATGLDNNPGNDDLVNALARIYRDKGEHDKMIALYEKIHETKPESLTAINDLVSYITAYGKGAAQLEKASKLLPPLLQSNQAFLLDTAAWFMYQQGQYEQARETLSKAKSLNSVSAVINYHLGMAYSKLGNKVQAAQYLQKAVDSKEAFNGLKEAKGLLGNSERK